MLDKVVDGMESVNFSYDAYMIEGGDEVSVTYSAPNAAIANGTYAVTIKEGVASILGITAATYYNEGAGWYRDMFEKAPVTEEAALNFFDTCTIKGMIAYDTIKNDIKKLTVYDRKYEPDTYFDVVYRFYYHVEAEHGYEMFFEAGYKDDQWLIKMVEKPFNWDMCTYVGFFN